MARIVIRTVLFIAVVTALISCAGSAPQVPYPVFMQSVGVSDTFLAGLPGVRAKVFSSDSRTRRASMLLQIPADWDFSTAAAPDKSLEIYVLEGDVTLGEFTLRPGGYAFLPANSRGVRMVSKFGALLLYFLDDDNPDSVIQTPIISDSELIQWQPLSEDIEDFGMATRELRHDPGSGARTWLLKIEPGAVQDWQQASAVQEGFLVSGHYRHSECHEGNTVAGEYTAGGYFLRPAGAVNGGPGAVAVESSVWLMRVLDEAVYLRNLYCGISAAR